MTNLPSVQDLEQTPCHVLHITEFADTNGYVMHCEKVYALQLYNFYFGYKEDFLCNLGSKVNQKENWNSEEGKCKIAVHKVMIGGKKQIYIISD